jgi:hypothetical protein
MSNNFLLFSNIALVLSINAVIRIKSGEAITYCDSIAGSNIIRMKIQLTISLGVVICNNFQRLKEMTKNQM